MASKRSLEELAAFVDGFAPAKPDDAASLVALRVGLAAANAGTYGVGCVILDSQGVVVCEGGNGVHGTDGFYSDLHAEMVALNAFEAAARAAAQSGSSQSSGAVGATVLKATGCTLISTLEPCPMCMTRLIFAGVGKVRYLCRDDIGGMVQRMDQLPPVFLDLTRRQGQEWGEALCSPGLRQAAFDVWNESQERLDRVVVERSGASGAVSQHATGAKDGAYTGAHANPPVQLHEGAESC